MSPKRKCTSDDMVMDSPSNTFHDRISNDNGDFYGSSDEKSLEDTLSLTCDDESLTSRSEDNTLEESSVVELSMYQSPALLRKRLPLALSPILGNDYGGESPMSYRNKLKSQTLWKKRSTVRILCFSVSILAYLFSTTLNYPSMITSIRGARLSKQSQEWNRFLRRKAPKIMKKMPSKSSNPQYTIRIKGRRLDLVLQSLDYHAQCPSVKNVQVEWTDPALKQLPKSVLKHKSGKVQAYGKSKTPAVFLLDEDILLKCDEIERAFQEWRLDPSRLVGFYPFHHQATAGPESDETFRLRQVSLGQGAYSMLSDRAVFVHNSYLRNFPAIPDKCQRLGLSIAVSSVTSKPPVAVMSNPQTTRQPDRQSAMLSRAASEQCQEWMETIGKPKLTDQVATIIGHQR